MVSHSNILDRLHPISSPYLGLHDMLNHFKFVVEHWVGVARATALVEKYSKSPLKLLHIAAKILLI